MKRLFLCSSFIPVSDFLIDFLDEDLKHKTVSFVLTASVVKKSTFYVKWAKEKLTSLGLKVVDVEISSMSFNESKKLLEKNDYIYVCGGNPFFLLDQLQKTKIDQVIIDQINKGKPYIGESSGAIVLGPNIEYSKPITGPEVVENPQSFDGLNILDFGVLPHYETFPFTEQVNEILASKKTNFELIPITNNQAIVINGQVKEIKSVFSSTNN